MTAFYILATVIFLTFLAGGTIMPFQPLYAESLGASLAQIGLIVGGFTMVGLVANLTWGVVCDRVGRRKPFLVGAMATLAITNLLASLAGVWWVLIPIRVVEGIAFGAYSVANLAMMGDVLEGNPHRARMIGAYRMSGSLAFSIAIVISGLIAQTYGFARIYRVAAGIYLAAFLISLAVPETYRAGLASAAQSRRVSVVDVLRGPMLPLLVVASSFSLPFSAVYSVWPIWIVERLSLGRATFSQLWGLAAFVEVPCMALAGYLADRFGRRLTFSAGLILFAGVYMLYLASTTLAGLIPPESLPAILAAGGGTERTILPVLIGAQVLRGFAFAAFTATALTMAIELSPRDARGSAAGLFQVAQSLAGIVGGYTGGSIAQALGFLTLFAGAAAVLLAGAAYVQVAVARPAERTAAR